MRILFIISTVFFASCAGTKNNDKISLRDKFNAGMENLEEKKYLQAQSDFKNVIIRGMGTDLGDDAQYYLGCLLYTSPSPRD